MRATLFLATTAMTILPALPAPAGHLVALSPSRPAAASAAPQPLGVLRARHRQPFFFHRPRGSLVIFPDVLADAAAPAPTTIIVNAAPSPAAAPAPPREKKATVETTPQGVVVVRGPGTRH